MSESGNYSPGAWSGHNFTAARASYDKKASSSAADAAAANIKASDLVPKSIETKSTHPFLIRCDVTGSMSGWPNTIFSKLPYLDHEMRTEYLAEDAEISFGAISDTGDEYPLQVQPFTKGTAMKDSLEKLVVTDGGSGPGSCCEAYAIAALYDARNVKMPKAIIKPPLIIIGDEMPYNVVSKSDAREYAKVSLEEGRLSANAIFKELVELYSVYLILKPYGSETFAGDKMSGQTKSVYDCWEEILGADRIALLPEAGRVVDVIFGVLAKETDRVDYFRKEIEKRQEPSQVKTVYKSLATIHALPAKISSQKLLPGGSRMHKPPDGTKKK